VGLGALEPQPRGVAATIGTFDGLHLGHRMLIARTIEKAAELEAESAVITWDRHPAATLRPDKMPPLLASQERKVELIGEMGVDLLVVLPFDAELSHLSPEDFANEVLGSGLAARHVYVGHDWRFGHKAAGDVPLLKEIGARLGFEVEGVGLQEVADTAVSSSRVRRAVQDGDMGTARSLLGRPFDVDGLVVRGAARGKDLGFPTANLEVDPHLARPPIGIYAGVAHVGGLSRPAAISVGVNPTFGGERGSSPVNIEAYLLDFSDEIYGETVRLEFWERLRDELRFDSVEALIAQIQADVDQTRRVIG
jgi:riboflavin kinase/FMN adenylyltransferase